MQHTANTLSPWTIEMSTAAINGYTDDEYTDNYKSELINDEGSARFNAFQTSCFFSADWKVILNAIINYCIQIYRYEYFSTNNHIYVIMKTVYTTDIQC